MKMGALGVALLIAAVVVIAFIADGPEEGVQFLALVAGVLGIFVISFAVHQATEHADELPDQS